MQDNKGTLGRDFLGALSGTAVVLPQSMGLGVVLFSVMGLDASSGALAGIIGAAILSIVSGLFGATIGMLSAPNGPITMLLVGVFSLMVTQGATQEEMLLTLSAILVVTGVFQILFSLVGGAQLVKYTPYPVVVGLVSGVGFLMIKSQLSFLTKSYSNIENYYVASTPLFLAMLTIVSIVLSKKFFPKLPAPLMGLITGVIAFQFIDFFYLHSAYTSWVVGVIPSFASLKFHFSLEAFSHLDITVIVSAAFALLILGTTDCLVTALVADSQTNLRHNGRKEIMAQGLAQILIGLLSGLGGWGTKGATLVNLQSGGRRWSPLFSGLLFVLLILFFGKMGEYLPISTLAGVIIFVGFGMLDFNIINWLRYKKSRSDALIALIVLGIIIFIDLITAVGVGVLISMLMYIRLQIKAPIIHRRSSGVNRRSLSVRRDEEEEILKEYGESILLFELQGDLFFATVDKLLETLDPYLKKDMIVILHFQRVRFIDLSGVILLLQIATKMQNIGGTLLLCHMHRELGIGRKINKALKEIDKKNSIKIRTFIDTDTAFEYAEDLLLARHNMFSQDKHNLIEVENNALCKEMSPSLVELIRGLCVTHTISKGEYLFKQGSYGTSLFMVLEGEIEIRLYSSDDEYKRFAKYAAGTYFGEISFLEPGERSASAVANSDTQLLELSKELVMQLKGKEKEELSVALLFELGSTLSKELRRSAQEIQRLETS